MRPFKLVPVFKDYLWGGTRLKTMFNKRTDLPLLAESWELSAHRDGDCGIADGTFAGMMLSEFLREHPDTLGRNVVRKGLSRGESARGELPLLIKLIDARENLSVQVHPDDQYANRMEGGAGKTEMWYVLSREPGSFLYCGFQREITREEMARRIEDGTILDVLQKMFVEPGDVFFMEAGTVHAIGAGILLAEIQQNSNITYRVYDYDRRGADGKRRPLHIEKAMDVACRTPSCSEPPGRGEPLLFPGGKLRCLASCAYFKAELLELSGEFAYRMDGGSFVSLLCLDGAANLITRDISLPSVAAERIEKGESVFVPAERSGFSLKGSALFLTTSIPGSGERV